MQGPSAISTGTPGRSRTTRASAWTTTATSSFRTTITLDEDVAALIESERARTGESFRSAVNRLLRRSVRGTSPAVPLTLPELPGRPLVDVSDVSGLLATIDDGRRAQRGVA